MNNLRSLEVIYHMGARQPAQNARPISPLRRSMKLSETDAAGRVAGTERAEMAQIAFYKICAVLMEGDQRTGGAGVAVFFQHVGRFVFRRLMTQNLRGD